ncbi:MAG: hypothetical protein ACYDH9_23375 [Limisphaerales bacterium]
MRTILVRFFGHWPLLCVVLGGRPLVASAETVFDNSYNYNNTFYTTLLEFGDELRLVGSARTVVDFRFEYYAEFTGNATAEVRFYANDGPGAAGFKAPGTQLYDSGPFPIYPDFNTKALTGLSVKVPDRFTWTVQFGGVSNILNSRAGLTLYDPPTAGSSFDDFWLNTPDASWELFHFGPEVVANFAVKVTALPDPTVDLVSQQRLTNGLVVLQLAGPVGRDFVLQLSTNLADWLSISTNALSSNPMTLLDDHSFFLDQVFYRGVLLPETTVKLLAPGTTTNGLFQFQYTGPVDRHLGIYASTNLNDWLPIGTKTLVGEPVGFTDPQATNFPKRFYVGVLLPEPVPVAATGSFILNGQFQVPLLGRPGHDFMVRASTDLVTWIPISTNTYTFHLGFFDFVDPAATNFAHRFYSVVPLP